MTRGGERGWHAAVGVRLRLFVSSHAARAAPPVASSTAHASEAEVWAAMEENGSVTRTKRRVATPLP